MKRKVGRPPVSKQLAKGALLSVRFSQDERKALARAADHDGVKLSEWARRQLLSMATRNTKA
jgi:uncharacterized protein (DUF1778 family)